MQQGRNRNGDCRKIQIIICNELGQLLTTVGFLQIMHSFQSRFLDFPYQVTAVVDISSLIQLRAFSSRKAVIQIVSAFIHHVVSDGCIQFFLKEIQKIQTYILPLNFKFIRNMLYSSYSLCYFEFCFSLIQSKWPCSNFLTSITCTFNVGKYYNRWSKIAFILNYDWQ